MKVNKKGERVKESVRSERWKKEKEESERRERKKAKEKVKGVKEKSWGVKESESKWKGEKVEGKRDKPSTSLHPRGAHLLVCALAIPYNLKMPKHKMSF
jgi:hypothetical protein